MNIYGNGTLPSPGNDDGNTPNPPASPIVPHTIGSFTYQSCYVEVPGRALSRFTLADDSITLRTRTGNCTQHEYFGVEYGRECCCGNTLGTGSAPATVGRCNMACAGDSSFVFGGPNGSTLYKNLNPTSSSPPPPPTNPSGQPSSPALAVSCTSTAIMKFPDGR